VGNEFLALNQVIQRRRLREGVAGAENEKDEEGREGTPYSVVATFDDR